MHSNSALGFIASKTKRVWSGPLIVDEFCYQVLLIAEESQINILLSKIVLISFNKFSNPNKPSAISMP